MVLVVRDAAVPFLPAFCTPDVPVLTLFADANTSTETEKNLSSVAQVWDFLLAHHATRNTLLVGVGGGVTTDIVGFAAATWQRGIKWVAVPTTLLAMVDASAGGKTGVNYGGLKNYIGAFHAPEETYIDVHYLDSLPGRQVLSGYAELVKTWLLCPDTDTASWSLPQPDAIGEEDIRRAVRVKEHYVALDPTEQGIRRALNLGHTVGHALESLSLALSPTGEEALLHGYAVMYGLVCALYLSHVRCGLDKQYVRLVSQLVTEYYGRPAVSCKQYPRLWELICRDKKQSFTLLQSPGRVLIDQSVSRDEVYEALDYLFSI